VSAAAFDLAGRLLVTASVTGRTLKVFKLAGKLAAGGAGADPSPQLVYALTRGTVTGAVICDVCFAPDSRWVAACSSHGTAHIFAINPAGGPVDGIPHCLAAVQAGAAAGAAVDGGPVEVANIGEGEVWMASPRPLLTLGSQVPCRPCTSKARTLCACGKRRMTRGSAALRRRSSAAGCRAR
jgi:hypothetical protein